MSPHSQATTTSVRTGVVVDAPIERAFRVFTEDFDRIKPHEHNMLAVEIAETVFEPRVGGRVYDRGVDGSECQWARVLAFEPPNRIVFSWDITPQFRLETDLERTSEVEVRFIAESAERTRVELEHRYLDRHGDGWEATRDVVAGDAGWPLYLQRFREVVAEQDEVHDRLAETAASSRTRLVVTAGPQGPAVTGAIGADVPRTPRPDILS